jgi:hypothetical protein
MGLNDEMEKLRQAEQWLMTCELTSQQSKAAWEHVCHVLVHSPDAGLRNAARKICHETGFET